MTQRIAETFRASLHSFFSISERFSVKVLTAWINKNLQRCASRTSQNCRARLLDDRAAASPFSCRRYLLSYYLSCISLVLIIDLHSLLESSWSDDVIASRERQRERESTCSSTMSNILSLPAIPFPHSYSSLDFLYLQQICSRYLNPALFAIHLIVARLSFLYFLLSKFVSRIMRTIVMIYSITWH